MIREKEILNYLTGDASPELKASVEAWANEDVNNQETLEFYRKLWSADVYQNDAIDFGTEDAWNAIEGKISMSTTQETSTQDVLTPQTNNSNQETATKVIPLWKKAISIAAVFALMASAFFLFRDNDPFLYADTPGDIELEDGSIITLAENSTLKYPKTFKKATERLVSIEGNATLKIAKNPEKVFIAEYQDTRVKVLGTTFSIKGDGNSTEVENIEGLIKFYVQGKEDEAITLKQGEKATYDGTGIKQVLPEPEPEPVKEEPTPEPEPVQEEPNPEPEPVKEEPTPEPEPVQEEPKEVEGMQDGKLMKEIAKKFPKMLKISDAFGYNGDKIPFDLSLLETADFETIMAAVEKEATLEITKKTKKGVYHIKAIKIKE